MDIRKIYFSQILIFFYLLTIHIEHESMNVILLLMYVC